MDRPATKLRRQSTSMMWSKASIKQWGRVQPKLSDSRLSGFGRSASIFRTQVLEQICEINRKAEQNAIQSRSATARPVAPGFPFRPRSVVRRSWDTVMACVVAVCVMVCPVEVAFVHTAPVESARLILILGLVLDGLWCLDILVWFVTAYEASTATPDEKLESMGPSLDQEAAQHKITLERRLSHIALHYLRSWFIIDLLALGPPTILLVSDGEEPSPLAALGMLKTLRWVRLLRGRSWITPETVLRTAKRPMLMMRIGRLLQLMSGFFALVHTVGCAFWLSGLYRPQGEWSQGSTWIETFVQADATFSQQYVSALYWAMVTATTVGYGDITPLTSTERAFTTVAVMFFAVLQSVLFGTITSLIDGMDVARKRYQAKRTHYDEFVRFSDLPGPLRRRIDAHMQYVWDVSKGFEMHSVLKELPDMLRQDVQVYLLKDMITRVPMFQGLEVRPSAWCQRWRGRKRTALTWGAPVAPPTPARRISSRWPASFASRTSSNCASSAQESVSCSPATSARRCTLSTPGSWLCLRPRFPMSPRAW